VGRSTSKKGNGNRVKFEILSELYRIFQPILRFQDTDRKLNSVAVFTKYNFSQISNLNDTYFLDYTSLCFSNRVSPYCLGFKITKGMNEFLFEWEQDKLCEFDSEKMVLIVFSIDSKNLFWTEVLRKEKQAKVRFSNISQNYFTFGFGYRGFYE
jgi:hypothetical protein